MNNTNMLVVAICGLLFIPFANASTIYEYQGNQFNLFAPEHPIGSNTFTGSITMPNELSANLDWVTLTPDSWSFTDGLTTVSNLTSGYTDTFRFSTDPHGEIIDWRILLLRPNGVLDVATFEIRTLTEAGNIVNIYDEATYCIEIGGGICTEASNAYASNPGSWSLVPIPAALWLFGTGLLGLIGVARRRKTT